MFVEADGPTSVATSSGQQVFYTLKKISLRTEIIITLIEIFITETNKEKDEIISLLEIYKKIIPVISLEKANIVNQILKEILGDLLNMLSRHMFPNNILKMVIDVFNNPCTENTVRNSLQDLSSLALGNKKRITAQSLLFPNSGLHNLFHTQSFLPSFETLPPEIILSIAEYLSGPELARLAATAKRLTFIKNISKFRTRIDQSRPPIAFIFVELSEKFLTVSQTTRDSLCNIQNEEALIQKISLIKSTISKIGSPNIYKLPLFESFIKYGGNISYPFYDSLEDALQSIRYFNIKAYAYERPLLLVGLYGEKDKINSLIKKHDISDKHTKLGQITRSQILQEVLAPYITIYGCGSISKMMMLSTPMICYFPAIETQLAKKTAKKSCVVL